MANPVSDIISKISGLAAGAARPEKVEPGPGDVGPTTETRGGSDPSKLVTLPMTPAECNQWWKRLEESDTRHKSHHEKWDILLNEYLPMVSKSGEPETVKVQGHFRNVHTKMPQLFYRTPELVLTPRDPGPSQDTIPNPMQAMMPPGAPPMPPLKMEDVISIKQSVLTEKLGRDGIKVERLMDELLFDVLGWSGIGCSKLGYRCVSRPMPAPTAQPGAVLGTGANSAAPVAQDIPIFEEWYWRRFSPKKLRAPVDLFSSRFDEDATWLAMHFYLSPKAAMARFGLTEAEAAKASEDDNRHKYDEDNNKSTPSGLVHGIEVWCKASHFTDELHPQAINQLVLIEGLRDRPVVWRPSPDQEFDQYGRLTNDSLIGFPIRVLTIRDLADSPFPPSDAAFTNSEIKQLSTWRRQSIQIRDAAIGKYFYDQGAFDTEEIDLIKNGGIGAYIGVADGKLAGGADKVFTTTAQIHAAQDDYRGFEGIKQDMNETLGISATQAGIELPTTRSATEVNAFRGASQNRSEKELGRTIDFYLDGARMIDSLLMRYATQMEYTNIAGQGGAKVLMAWNNRLISGKYLYDIAPDSQLKMDTAQDFQLTLNYYNQCAKDPLSNRGYVLRRLARMRGMDPSKAVIDPSQLPKPAPEPPRVSVALSGEDLQTIDGVPVNPVAYELVVNLLEKNKEAAAAGGQPPHGGSNTPGEMVNQHSASNSGGAPNAPDSTNHRQSQVK